MLAKIRQVLAERLTGAAVHLIAKTGLSPNALTAIGLLLNFGIAYLLASGHLILGGALVLFSGWFDLLDGALARATGRTTKFGALFDSTIDRISEALVFLGLLLFFTWQYRTGEGLLIYAALVGSLLISYIRARAEGLGLECKVGLFTRAERVVLLALGLILSQLAFALLVTLWLLAVGTNLTAAQRLLYIWQQTRKEQRRRG